MNRSSRRALLPWFVLCAAVLSGCGAASPAASDATRAATATPGPTDATVESQDPIRIAVAGDSNSTGVSGTLESGVDAGTAWVSFLPAELFTWVGGWARDGATTEQIAANVSTVQDVDVLVVMAGTNDAALGVSPDITVTALEDIARGVGADWTVVAALPPLDFAPGAIPHLNERLEVLAAERGWGWVDPWVAHSTPKGDWNDEFRTDGVHTSIAGYQAVAEAITAYLSSAPRAAAG